MEELREKRRIDYCLYSRKSTERDEFQALSIDSQIKEMSEIAQREKIKIVEVLKESHSAKDSGERPVFNQMIQGIKADKYQGILTWAPDRLSRNAGDLGRMVDLMNDKYLLEIRTYNQAFTNSPNDKFLLMILGSQAKLENDNRGINVKRGLRVKCEMGYRSGVSPLGYLNEKGENKGQRRIYLDPERAPIIKEMFERVAYQGYSGRDIYRWINNETNFRTRGGHKMTLSNIYIILKNHYYYGKFNYPEGSDNWYTVNHESIITKKLFDDVQIRISTHPKTKPGTKEFNFTKLIKCGSCQSGVTAEEKFKRFQNGAIRRYVYYHCTRSRDLRCPEVYIREEDLIEELMVIINKLPLSIIKAQDKIRREIKRYNKFNLTVLNKSKTNHIKIPKINIRNFAKYILQEGSREEKRELLTCLKGTLYLKNKKILLKN